MARSHHEASNRGSDDEDHGSGGYDQGQEENPGVGDLEMSSTRGLKEGVVIGIPKGYIHEVDEDKWGLPLAESDVAAAKFKVLNGHLIHQRILYRQWRYKDYDLWGSYQQDFVGWSVDTFKAAKAVHVRKLRDTLRQHGVFVVLDKVSIAPQMVKVLSEVHPHPWSDEDIHTQMSINPLFHSRHNPDAKAPSQRGRSRQPSAQNDKDRRKSGLPIPLGQLRDEDNLPQRAPVNIDHNTLNTDHNSVPQNLNSPQPALNLAFGLDGKPLPTEEILKRAMEEVERRRQIHVTNKEESKESKESKRKDDQFMDHIDYFRANFDPGDRNPPQHQERHPEQGQMGPPGRGADRRADRGDDAPRDRQEGRGGMNIKDDAPSTVERINPSEYEGLIPPSEEENVTKQMTDLSKLYQDKQRYGGSRYDLIDPKLTIFYEKCRNASFPAHLYHRAFPEMLKDKAASFYYDFLVGKNLNFTSLVSRMKAEFETKEVQQRYMKEWESTTLESITIHPKQHGKDLLDCLNILFTTLSTLQKGLPLTYHGTEVLRDKVIAACQNVDECSQTVFLPTTTYHGACEQLRAAVSKSMSSTTSWSKMQKQRQQQQYGDTKFDHNYVDRSYSGRGGTRGNLNASKAPFRRRFVPNRPLQTSSKSKKCYVCQKEGCWSTSHLSEERKTAFARFKAKTYDPNASKAKYNSFLAEVEGVSGLSSDDDGFGDSYGQYMGEEEEVGADDSDTQSPDGDEYSQSEMFLTDFGDAKGEDVIAILADQSAKHAFTSTDVFSHREPPEAYTSDKSANALYTGEEVPRPASEPTAAAFTFESRYSSERFQGIMPDSGAAGISTAGQAQVDALLRLFPDIEIDKYAIKHTIRFGKGTDTLKGTISVPTPVGPITFHVVPANTPFLWCIQDMDRMKVRLDNLENVLIQGDKRVPIVRKWGHPWMLIDGLEQTLAYCHLTEQELRQVHRRFGHPSIQRLSKLLGRAGYNVDTEAIRKLTEFCKQCQLHQKAPGRFKFTIRDDYHFNYEVVMDVMWIDSDPVLQVVDVATGFQAARFLQNMSAKCAFDTLKECWIDTYQGPPDFVVHDAGKNFASAEFRQQMKSLAIQVKEVPVEAHNSVGKVERYHAPLRRAYDILAAELEGMLSPENILQMAVKAVNDSAGPNGLVPTLLVFGAYPRIVEDSPPSPNMAIRAEAIRKATRELRQMQAKRQMNDALAMRNGPDISAIHALPLQSDVRVFREGHGWTGPFKLLSIDGEKCILDMPSGPTAFRSVVVRPFLTDKDAAEEVEDSIVVDMTPLITGHEPESNEPQPQGSNEDDEPLPPQRRQPRQILIQKRTKGRPKGSKNKEPKGSIAKRRKAIRDVDLETLFVAQVESGGEVTMVFMTQKEKDDYELCLELRRKGTITTPGRPFQASDVSEINGLTGQGVFRFEEYDEAKHGKLRIFKSRIIHEIKGKTTKKPYEKSRLVISGHSDRGKEFILTQSPTIQRASQRLILALAPSLFVMTKKQFGLWLRDITQAYTQSETELIRQILAYLPKEIAHLYPKGTIMKVIKPLYGVTESGTHWFVTYSTHHKEKLLMKTSTFDPCFLITQDSKGVGIVGMQTDDTIILCDKEFAKHKDEELMKAKLRAKPKEKLAEGHPLIFNGCILTKEDKNLVLRQKDQGKKLDTIDDKNDDHKQEYLRQRARGAYIASICQPEAAFDLSIAAQHQDPDKIDIAALNKRLRWQMDSLQRGLVYIPLRLPTTRLFIFVGGSLANNKDLTSQLGYVIVLANEDRDEAESEFTIEGNVVHWSSTKSKRVTRSSLASEIYGMVAGVDMGIVINSTLRQITDELKLPQIETVVCTDSFSLYECLVKLGTTKEKRLMIDIMSLRESYEERELYEIRWINGKDNPADAMTKANPNKTLETLIDTNSITIRVEGWVKRNTEPAR